MEERINDMLVRLFTVFGALKMIDYLQNKDEDEQKAVKFLEAFEDFVKNLEDKFRNRVFNFRDRCGTSLLKMYVIQWNRGETLDGTPTIVINDFSLGLKGEKNPVINLILEYDEIEVRDEDFEKINFMLK